MFVVMHEKTRKTIEQARRFEILLYQTTIVVTSIDIHVLTLLPCQNFQQTTPAVTKLRRAPCNSLTICGKTPYLCTIDPQNLAE